MAERDGPREPIIQQQWIVLQPILEKSHPKQCEWIQDEQLEEALHKDKGSIPQEGQAA
jgi:hypothetical protein